MASPAGLQEQPTAQPPNQQLSPSSTGRNDAPAWRTDGQALRVYGQRPISRSGRMQLHL